MDSSPLSDYKGRDFDSSLNKAPLVSTSLHTTTTNNSTRYDPVNTRDVSPPRYERSMGKPRGLGLQQRGESRDRLVSEAASMGGRDESRERAPRLPDVDFGHAY